MKRLDLFRIRATWSAGLLSVLTALALPAVAQQRPAGGGAPALPPSSPLFGRPNTEAAMKLVPVVAPATPATAETVQAVIAQLKLARGFNIEVYATGVPNARSMRQGEKGTVFVGSRLIDKVHAIFDKGGKREVKVIASGLYRPNGLAIKDGTLYIAELSQISKIEKIEDSLDDPPKPTVFYTDLPKDEVHGAKFIGIGPDSKLYVPVSQPCNNCIPSDAHGQIRRMNLDGTGVEVIARGVRNTVGFDWHPLSKELYFTDNGRDWISEDLPEDELNRLTKSGQHFGAPYCYQGNVLDPEFGWGHACGEFVPPVARLGPHVAPLGMRFNTGSMFPAKYKNAIFIARHGSWNRSKKYGGDIVAVFLNKEGTATNMEVIVSGFIGADNNYIGRPCDVLFLKDGSMLIADDFNGAIYRLTYGGSRSSSAK